MIYYINGSGKVTAYLTNEDDLKLVDDAVGKNLRECLPAGISSLVLKHANELDAVGKMFRCEFDLDVAGDTFRYEARILKSGIDAYTVIVEDMTGRQNAELAFAEVKEQLDIILFNLPVGVAILEGPEFRYFLINRYLAQLNGMPVEAHLGRTLAEVLPHARETIIPELENVLETGTPILDREFEMVLPKGNESVHLIDWQIPIINKNGKPKSIVSVVCDVTELKKTQLQLQRAQKMEALGTLSGGIAHDFNNILAVILGNSDMLKSHLARDAEGAEILGNIEEAAGRARDLVGQILTFSRADKTSLRPVDMGETVLDILRVARAFIPANIEFQQNIQQDCGLVMADATLMKQVVLNLCANSYHAIGESAGTVAITMRKIVPEDFTDRAQSNLLSSLTSNIESYLLLEVRDTGCGIPAEIMGRIFDPFFTTKQSGEGTGLGLAVVQGIAETHGGEVKVASTPGVGTTVRMFLPLVEGMTELPPVEDESVPDCRCVVHSGERRHLLVVEDELALRVLYRRLLEELGYHLTLCADGASALELFLKNRDMYDLVFTDQSMPGLSGLELCVEIQAVRPGLPIILATGAFHNLEGIDARDLGIRRVLKKPFKLDLLSRTLGEILSEHGGGLQRRT